MQVQCRCRAIWTMMPNDGNGNAKDNGRLCLSVRPVQFTRARSVCRRTCGGPLLLGRAPCAYYVCLLCFACVQCNATCLDRSLVFVVLHATYSVNLIHPQPYVLACSTRPYHTGILGLYS